MSINYKFTKMFVRFKQRMRKKRERIAFKKISAEQIKVFNMVKDIAVKYNSAIKFDPKSDEILIILPKMLVTLKGETVYIHNTTGFMSMMIPSEAYEILVELIEKEAHKERRKLKHDVKKRINEFLNQIIEAEIEE